MKLLRCIILRLSNIPTTKRNDEHAALIVDRGRLRITYNGHPCDFKDSSDFELMARFAKHPGMAIEADKAVVSRLRIQFSKDELLAPIAKAINSKGGGRYTLDPDAIGGVKLVVAPPLD